MREASEELLDEVGVVDGSEDDPRVQRVAVLVFAEPESDAESHKVYHYVVATQPNPDALSPLGWFLFQHAHYQTAVTLREGSGTISFGLDPIRPDQTDEDYWNAAALRCAQHPQRQIEVNGHAMENSLAAAQMLPPDLRLLDGPVSPSKYDF